jgi:sporulation protein YlmC with PRC-barrel domain
MSNPNQPINQVREGMDVYGSDGGKIGEVGDVNIGTASGTVTSTTTSEEQSYFRVRRGFLGLGDDLWIPAEEIAEVGGDRVTIRATSDEASRRGWGTEPTTPEAGSTGADGLADLGLRDDR